MKKEPIKLVVDANTLFSALLKDGMTRKIMKSDLVELYAPEYLLEEYRKYFSDARKSHELVKKINLGKQELSELKELLLKDIQTVREEEYLPKLEEIEITDEKDKPYLAAALAKQIPVWSDDAHLKQQNKIKVYTTTELISKLKT